MDDAHQGLYIRWCQSSRVGLVIPEGEGKASSRYVVPRELLVSRSRFFREHIPDGAKSCLSIPLASSVTERIMNQFFIWLLSPHPKVHPDITFEDITNLGLFAHQYQMPALSNQITDRIRTYLANDEWHLNPRLVDRIYQIAPVGTPIREVIRAALGKLPKSSAMLEAGADRDEWKATILKHAELGWDYIEASSVGAGKGWTAEGYLSGVCRFHDHEDVKEQRREEVLCDGCPFVGVDCYPVLVKQVETGSGTPSNIQSDEVLEDAGAVQHVTNKPEEAWIYEDLAPAPAIKQKVGNGIMITDNDDYHISADLSADLDVIPEIPTELVLETNGHASHRRANGVAITTATDETIESLEESNETVTSEDQADDSSATPVMRNIGTTMRGNVMGSAEKAADDEDEAAKLGAAKLKSRKKKKRERGASFSIGAST